jgi:hypothetical protein
VRRRDDGEERWLKELVARELESGWCSPFIGVVGEAEMAILMALTPLMVGNGYEGVSTGDSRRGRLNA